jgi:hypothetical protein
MPLKSPFKKRSFLKKIKIKLVKKRKIIKSKKKKKKKNENTNLLQSYHRSPPKSPF